MKKFWVSTAVFFFINLTLPSTVAGSPFVLLHQKDGSAPDDLFGSSVAGVEDVDGDGAADFIIGAPQADPNGIIAAGSAYVYSGATGAVIYQINGAAQGDFLGTSATGTGDVNGDGRADFMVSAPYTDSGGAVDIGTVYIYSGIDGNLLYHLSGSVAGDYFGSSMAGIGDVNSDGKADFIVGSPYADSGGLTSNGSAYVYSGATGTLLYQKKGITNYEQLGFSVAGAGDVNGDGKADFLIGAPGINSVFIYSGEAGELIRQIDGSAVGGAFGYSVAGMNDVNDDGKADVVVGAPFFNAGSSRPYFAGSALVYSGTNGVLLYQKEGPGDSTLFGNAVAGTGDVDGDGRADFVVGAPWARSGIFGANDGAIFVYSGTDGTTLFQQYGSRYDGLGQSVATVEDVNGDGKNDFIAGAPGTQTGIGRTGSAFEYGLICPVIKGDMNGDSSLTSADIVLMLNCTFSGNYICCNSIADVDCDGLITPSDVVFELLAAFLSQPFPC